ncbi:hypothetical protein C348_02446 [Cryptococcus neoformans Gb118]|nr:hypothetical protein C348_02446 [Cryptococcus neoformans var. grubii Gb118]
MVTYRISQKYIVPTSSCTPHQSCPASVNDDPLIRSQSPMDPSPDSRHQSFPNFRHTSTLIKGDTREDGQYGLQSHWSDWGSENSRAGGKKDDRFSGGLKRMFTKSGKNGKADRSRCSSAGFLLSQPKERSSPVKYIESPIRSGRPATEYFPNFLKVSTYTPIRPHTRLDDSHGAGCSPRSIERSMSKHKRTPLKTSNVVPLHWKSMNRATSPSTVTSREPSTSPLKNRTTSLVQRLQSLDNLPDSRYPGPKAKGSYGTPTPERPRPVRRPSQPIDLLPDLECQSSSAQKGNPQTRGSEEDVFSAPASQQEPSRRKRSSAQPTRRKDLHEQPSWQPSRSLSTKRPPEANIAHRRNYSASSSAQHRRQGSMDRAEALVILERMKSMGKLRIANPDPPGISNSSTTHQLEPSPTKPVNTCSLYGGLASDSDDSLIVNKTSDRSPDKYFSKESQGNSPVKAYTTPSRSQAYASFRKVQSSRKTNTPAPTRSERSPHRPVVGSTATRKSQLHNEASFDDSFVDNLACLTSPQPPPRSLARSSTGNMSVFHGSHIGSPSPKNKQGKEVEELLLDSDDAGSVDEGDYRTSFGSVRRLSEGNSSVTDMYLESFYGDDVNGQDTTDESPGLRIAEDGPLLPKSLRKTKKIGDRLVKA